MPALYALIGVRAPVFHDDAWASRTLRELWGKRWNQAVGGWLRQHFHDPLRRRGHPALGIVAAFGASAVVHGYLILVSVGALWAACATLVFLLQVPLLAAERALKVEQWRPLAARAWTIGVLLVVLPLFMEPVAIAIDPLLAAMRTLL